MAAKFEVVVVTVLPKPGGAQVMGRQPKGEVRWVVGILYYETIVTCILGIRSILFFQHQDAVLISGVIFSCSRRVHSPTPLMLCTSLAVT